MERSTVIAVDAAIPSNAAAVLTLKRGVSGFCVWSFDACDVGATISVGACDRCDWQVVAPGIAPIVLLFTGQTLFVKSERLCEKALLNGAPLWPGWVPLEHGDTIELGNACIEVALPAEATRLRKLSAAACPNDAPLPVRSQALPYEEYAAADDGALEESGTVYAPADWYVRAHVENASYVATQAERVLARASSSTARRQNSAMAASAVSAASQRAVAAAGSLASPRAEESGVYRAPAPTSSRIEHGARIHASRHDVHVITAPQWGARCVQPPRAPVAEPPTPSFVHSRYAAESSSAFIAERSVKRLDRPTQPDGSFANETLRLNPRVAADSQRLTTRLTAQSMVNQLSDSGPAARTHVTAAEPIAGARYVPPRPDPVDTGLDLENSFRALESAVPEDYVQRTPAYRQTVPQWSGPSQDVASVLGERSSFVPDASFFVAKMSRSMYATLGVLTALAYAGWLVVLDHL